MTTLDLAPRDSRPSPALIATGVTAVTFAATAAWVALKARRAERRHPAAGRFLAVEGTQLHYLDVGQGPPVVLLHGNVVDAEDFMASGLVERLAREHRVIAFDRPGFGYSERPRGRLWTAAAQAAVLQRALARLGIHDAVVVGHSWGTLVALELAHRAPDLVRELVLISGYYFPTPRADVAFAAPPGLPIVGDLLRYTVSPMLARLMLNRTVKAMFAPQPVPGDFLPTLSREMLVRPSQLRANAQDAAFMIPSAASLRKRYGELDVPVTIFAGDADRVVDPDHHACRLHRELRGSEFHLLPGVGHMAHYAAPERIAEAIEVAAS